MKKFIQILGEQMIHIIRTYEWHGIISTNYGTICASRSSHDHGIALTAISRSGRRMPSSFGFRGSSYKFNDEHLHFTKGSR